MELNEVIKIIEDKIGRPVSLKMLVKLLEEDIITVKKTSNFKFGVKI